MALTRPEHAGALLADPTDATPSQSAIVRTPPGQQEVGHMMHRILALAQAHDADTDLMALAMADALSMIALSLDRYAQRMPLQDRLDTFCARVRVSYEVNSR